MYKTAADEHAGAEPPAGKGFIVSKTLTGSLYGAKIVYGDSDFNHDDQIMAVNAVRDALSVDIRILSAMNRNGDIQGEAFYAPVKGPIYISLYVRDTGSIECGFHDREEEKLWRCIDADYLSRYKNEVLNAIYTLETRIRNFTTKYPIKYKEAQKKAWAACFSLKKEHNIDVDDRLRPRKSVKTTRSHAPPFLKKRNISREMDL